MIIATCGEKGGTGKTTLATNLAGMRSVTDGDDLLLVDADHQATASFWCAIRDQNNLPSRVGSVQKYGTNLRNDVEKLKLKYKTIVIDTGGRDSIEMRGALLIADVAIFPLRASQFDLWTLTNIDKLVEIAQQVNGFLTAKIVLNQLSTNHATKEAESAVELIGMFKNLELMQTRICERVIYRKAAITGNCVIELPGNGLKAHTEMMNLYNETFDI